MFKFHQFNLPPDFVEMPTHKHVKIRFHSNLSQEEKKVWSINKIIKLLNISKDVMFKNAFYNFRFKVVRGDQKSYIIVDFLLMNPHDSMMLVQIMSKLNKKEDPSPTTYNTTFSHVKVFSILYYSLITMSDIELAKVFRKTVPRPSTSMDRDEQFGDGEALQNPKGIIFNGKNGNKGQKNYMFYTYLKERFSTLHINNILL